MWKNIAIVVLIILLLVTTYISYNNKQIGKPSIPQECPIHEQQIGINYKVRSQEDALLMSEMQDLINSAKPYYCHYAKEYLGQMKSMINQNWETYDTFICDQIISELSY